MIPATRYARNKGGQYVAYQVFGTGDLDLVFIPDWCTNLEVMWEEPTLARFLQRLASFSRVICFDKRGTGVSDPVPLGAIPTWDARGGAGHKPPLQGRSFAPRAGGLPHAAHSELREAGSPAPPPASQRRRTRMLIAKVGLTVAFAKRGSPPL